MEQGNSCYVGDSNCNVPVDVEGSLPTGQYVLLNKAGKISAFSNALYGLWFSMVTLTSTGYGDIVPSTNLGEIMTVFLMLFGAMYMAMPLAAASTVFYAIHDSYHDNRKNKKKAQEAELALQSDPNKKKRSRLLTVTPTLESQSGKKPAAPAAPFVKFDDLLKARVFTVSYELGDILEEISEFMDDIQGKNGTPNMGLLHQKVTEISEQAIEICEEAQQDFIKLSDFCKLYHASKK